MPFLVRHQYDMHYELIASPSERDILFIHGNVGSINWWVPTVDEWRKRDSSQCHEFILAEWMGCGRSKTKIVDPEWDAKEIAKDYIALLQSLDKTEVDIVGHSAGGLIAMLCLHECPSLFRKAVLLDPVSPWGLDMTPELWGHVDRMKRDSVYRAQCISQTIRHSTPEDFWTKKLIADASQVDSYVWQKVPQALSGIDFDSSLDQIEHSTLVIHGAKDDVLPMESSRRLADRLTNGDFLELREAGHSFNIESPEEFVPLLQSFFDSVPSSQAIPNFKI